MVVYVEADEFKNATARSGDPAELNDLDALLEMASRHIERKLEVARDYWAPVVGVREFVGVGGSVLWFSEDNRGYCATSITAIDSDHFVPTYRELPANAIFNGEPYNRVEAVHGVWLPGALYQISATWGWPETPGEVNNIVIMICDQVIRTRKAGPLAILDNIDTAIQLTPGLPRLLRDLADGIGRQVGVLA